MKKDRRPIWEVVKEITDSIPEEEWEKLPKDGAMNHDHYLYGTPKIKEDTECSTRVDEY